VKCGGDGGKPDEKGSPIVCRKKGNSRYIARGENVFLSAGGHRRIRLSKLGRNLISKNRGNEGMMGN